MFKFIVGIQIAYWLGFVLFNSEVGFLFQLAYIGVYALVQLVPAKTWLTIGEAFAELAPWIFFWSL